MKKEEIEMLATNLVADILDDKKDSFETICNIDFQIKVLENAKEKIKSRVVSDLQREGGKKNFDNYKIEIAEVGTKYHFENTKHPRYLEILDKLNELNQEKKDIEVFLKSIKGSTTIVVDDEVLTIYEVPKYSTTSFKLTLK